MAEPKYERKHLWTLLLVPLRLVLILLPVFTVVLLWAYQRRRIMALKKKVAIELDAIRKAGYPATLKELDAWYAYPDGPNAADIYDKAFAKLTDVDKWRDLPCVGGGELPPLGQPLPKELKKRIAEFLAENAEAIELFHKAAEVEGCRYPVNFLEGHDVLLPHLGRIRDGARRLKLAVILAAERGNADEAARAIRSSLAAAESVRNEPNLISQLVRIACLAITMNGLEEAMSRTRFSDAQRADFAVHLEAAERPETMIRAFAGERCVFDAALMPGGGLWKDAEEKALFGSFFIRASGVALKARLMWLETMGRYVKALDGSLQKRFVASRAEEAAVEAELNKGSYKLSHLAAHFVGMLLPAYHHSVCEDLKCFGLLRAARTALAVEGFRAENGKLPKTLDELVPRHLKSVPLDPFDGKPLRYKILEKGYVIYSIGRDLADNGGAGMEKVEGDDEQGADVPFTVAR